MAVLEASGKLVSEFPAVATGFGAGFGFKGATCGALSGGVMAIGVLSGRTSPIELEKKLAVYEKVYEFYDIFEEVNGAVTCRELTGVDLATEEGARLAEERDIPRKVCDKVIASSAEILCDLLSG